MSALNEVINNFSLIFFTNIIIEYDNFLVILIIQIIDWNNFIITGCHYIIVITRSST